VNYAHYLVSLSLIRSTMHRYGVPNSICLRTLAVMTIGKINSSPNQFLLLSSLHMLCILLDMCYN